VSARRLRVALERSVYIAVDLQTGQSFMISPSGEGATSLDWEPGQVARLPAGVQVNVSFATNPTRPGRLLPTFTPPLGREDGR